MNQEILDLKLAHLTEVLTDLNVDILGICEVENRKVLEMWNNHYPNRDYTIVHYESPDNRGIDAALFYDEDKFTLLESSPISISFPDGDPSRDILYVKGIALSDTLHIFVNHWPSRYRPVHFH